MNLSIHSVEWEGRKEERIIYPIIKKQSKSFGLTLPSKKLMCAFFINFD